MFRYVVFGLNLFFLGMAAFALIDAMRRPADAYLAVERQTKVAWGIFLGLACAIMLLFGAVNFLGIIGVIVTMFYLVDVRPRLRDITARY